ncbi:hypothetical protein UP10_15455 [Bradyrhizobium sp. LTSPM299]|uniref:hypothetical protein n=1 Tax=Bradyrhizobium sp. LTSPM299 TaxID=1619233 RepID=UPI0005CA727C|nr:hypothetical protein [Bradyrhizobium sp. LTSPM299]KJC60065.1 hypothetical protein UP10_15455 [Bradyrhizobium sp. LTSPM299]
MPGEVTGQISTVSTAWAVFSVIGGSLLGGAVSTVVAFVVQKRNLDSAKKQREEDRLDVRKVRGYALLFKMIRMASNMENLSKAMRSCFDEAAKQGFRGAPWQIVQPMVPATDPVNFTPEEMALILSIDDKLFNEIASLDQLHNSTAAIFEAYGKMRQKVLDRFGAVMAGNVGVTGLTQEQANWLAPRATELNGLVAAMQQRCDQDGQELWAVLLKLRDALETKLGIKHRLERRDAQPVSQ